MTLPPLGLSLARRPPESLLPLLTAMFRWCVPAALDPVAPAPAAILTTPAVAQDLQAGVPIGLWTRSAGEARSAVAGRAAAAVVSDAPTAVEAAGRLGVFAASGRHAWGRRPMPPFVRERLRRARGLPEVAVVEQDGDRWRWPGGPDPLDAELVPTAMACASAAIVLDPARLLEALAWGTPSVTCADAAGQVGALASTHVLVGAGRRDRLSLARRLARDPALAAGLSWAGRRLVEQRHDVDSAAARLAELLGLRPPPPAGALAAASLQLALLGTPDGAAIRCRLGRAVACLHRNEVR